MPCVYAADSWGLLELPYQFCFHHVEPGSHGRSLSTCRECKLAIRGLLEEKQGPSDEQKHSPKQTMERKGEAFWLKQKNGMKTPHYSQPTLLSALFSFEPNSTV